MVIAKRCISERERERGGARVRERDEESEGERKRERVSETKCLETCNVFNRF